jgi:adenylate cyclase
MFTSFRNRLLFWFLLFIGINLIIIGLINAYLVERKKISEIIRTVERVNVLVLKDVKTQQDFFGYETKNDSYFLDGNSKFLNNHKELSESILHNINLISASHNSLTNEEHIRRLRKLVGSTDSIFLKLVKLINVRGYKDFNLEGKMRNHAHWLEDHKVFSSMDILNLRRHEKDYIIRNEQEYVNRFNHLISRLRSTARLSSRKDSSVFHLDAYNESFNKLVHLDQQIGIKANTGLKEQLDSKHVLLETAINDLVVKANRDENTLLQNLTYAYAALVTLLIAGSIILSLILSRK